MKPMWLTVMLLASLNAPGFGVVRDATPQPGSFDPVELVDGLRLVDFATNLGDDDAPFLLGLLSNDTDEAFSSPFLTVAFLDEEGDILGETMMFGIGYAVIPPRSLATVIGTIFSEEDAALFSDYADVEVSPLTGGIPRLPADSGRTADFELDVEDLSADESGSAEVDTRVTNSSTTRIEAYSVAVSVLDDDDHIIGAGYGSAASGLRPDQSANVSVGVVLIAPLPNDYRLEAFASENIA